MRFQLVPAAYVYLLRGEAPVEVLLQLRRGTGFMDGHWAATAGHIERGESVFAAACREAEEEAGVTIAAADLHPLTVMHRTRRSGAIDERVDFFFACRSWTGEPRLVEPDKAAELRWWPLDALPDPVVPHELEVLTGLGAGTLPLVTAHGFTSNGRRQ